MTENRRLDSNRKRNQNAMKIALRVPLKVDKLDIKCTCALKGKIC